MSVESFIDIDKVPTLTRGGGIVTRPLVARHNIPDAKISTGITRFPPGQGAPMHLHNCDEQVTVLEGTGIYEVADVVTELKAYDTTYIPAGQPHRFQNTGDAPMAILWIYASSNVTRTFTGTGETVEHLSSADMMVVE